MPRRPLELRNVQRLTIRRNRQPVAPTFKRLVPDDFARNGINRNRMRERRHINSAGFCAACNSFDVLGLFAVSDIPGWDTAHEFVSLIYVENENTDAPVFGVIAYPRTCNIKQMLFALFRSRRRRDYKKSQ